MRIHATQAVFPWEQLDDTPSLRTLKACLERVPDSTLLNGLRQGRGHGRNDYPVTVLWGVMLLEGALRHPSTEACLNELARNPSLARLIGIESPAEVPKPWNMSRFLEVLGQEPHRSNLREVFDRLVTNLGQAVPDLGRATAGDASWLNARRPRDKAHRALKQKRANDAPADKSTDKPTDKVQRDLHGLPLPAGGRKEYTDDAGAVVKAVEWFGYKFHLLVDVKHEVTLAYQISSTKVGDNEVLPDLLKQAKANLPEGRIKTLAYDKAADDNDTHRLLAKEEITPLIQMRSLWKDELERALPGGVDGNIIYDEAGTVYCYDQQSDPPVRHRMSYIGHEPKRGTIKYRCPAMHEDWRCPNHVRCNAGKSYGLTVRVKQEIDLRRFPQIPRATKKFERLYKGRTAVERVNARLKVFWGADDGNVTGAPRFHAKLGTIMVVHAAFATLLAGAPRWERTLGHTRLSPIAKALNARPPDDPPEPPD